MAKRIRLDKNSTRGECEAVIGLSASAAGWGVNYYTGPWYRQPVTGVRNDGEGLILNVGSDPFGLENSEWIEFELPADPPEITESLQECKARLEAELAEVNEAIAREGAPADCAWSKDENGTRLRHDDGRRIEWDNDAERSVYFDDGPEAVSLPSPMVFAWVDRVRKNGETDL